MFFGQDKGAYYRCYEAFLSFDTSVIPDDDTITAATLYLYAYADESDTDFVMEARAYDWGATLSADDWVPGADFSGKTLLASKTTAGGISTEAYTELVSEAALTSAIDKTGNTRFVLCSSRMTNGNSPSGDEWVRIYESSAAAGLRPKLVVEHSGAPVLYGTLFAIDKSETVTAYGDGDLDGWVWATGSPKRQSTRHNSESRRYVLDESTAYKTTLRRGGLTSARKPFGTTTRVNLDAERSDV
jgi:hypothetical protein